MNASQRRNDSEAGRTRSSVGTFHHRILDHFHHPRNAGIAEDFNHSFLEQDNPWLIRIRFTLRVADNRIEDVKFQTQSCVTTTACCSALTEMVQGQPVERAMAVTPEQLSAYLGTIPQEKMHCARLAVATLRRSLGQQESAASNTNPQEGPNP
ncbi:MAG: iron-sulfur cluster assembly scaffold protein [Acidobacteria bacterium]|nr:iron-sulfur cluster assembly scaffold protein [Acidobacteriota bacterium]